MKNTSAATMIDLVEDYCLKNGIRFTDPRRYVLEIVAMNDGKPVGAYDVLKQLEKKIDNPKPPTAYRALEFLQEHGFIHRIESLNAYVICHADHQHNGSQFMICDDCGKVIETHLCSMPESLTKRTQAEGFNVTQWSAELHGTCRECHN